MRGIRHSKEARQAHIDAWRASGLSQLRYAQEHGLGKNALPKWIALSNRANRLPTVKAATAFVPVIIRSKDANPNAVRFDDVRVNVGKVQVQMGQLSAAQLTGLLSLLEQRPC